MIVAFFCMPEPGHFHRLRGVIAGVAAAGHEARVYTDRRFETWVATAGGTFVDLFARRPLDAADARSQPVPCRYVSFAAHFAEDVLRELRDAPPALVVYDTFAVIGRVVADKLGVPGVNVCAGHNVQPKPFLERLEHDPRVRVADECFRAADVLRERYGLTDASPFSYVSALSPQLNLYCEPPVYLDEKDREVFEPIAFFGSLPDVAAPESAARSDSRTRVYVSFGTIVWRYFEREALETLHGLVASFATMTDVDVRISLGGANVDASGLRAPNVRVESYVDQCHVLHESDVFVTHQGLNSTHEAAYCGVPMISRPFFWDQPALAEVCRALGLAVPLEWGDDREDVAHSMEVLRSSKERFAESLARARRWEEEVIAGRPVVIERMLALA